MPGFTAAHDQYAEWSEKHPEFKVMYESYNKYLKSQVDWFQVVEGTHDNYLARKLRGRG